MARRRRMVLTAAVGAAAVAGTLVVTGAAGGAVSGTTGLLTVLDRVGAPAAQALPAFQDCAQLRSWYVRQALPKVGPWGLSGPPVMYASGPLSRTSADAGSVPGAGPAEGSSSTTGTNVQEAGVDEPDVAKTDGRVVVRVVGGQLVVTGVAHGIARELSRTTLPGRPLSGAELLLDGDRVTVVGEDQPVLLQPLRPDQPVQPDQPDQREPGRTFAPPRRGTAQVRVLSMDLGAGGTPHLVADRRIDGDLLSARQYADGTVRVVTTTTQPRIAFVQPGTGRSATQAEAENRRILRGTSARAWLPRLDGQPLRCGDVRHPLRGAGAGTISVLTLSDDARSADATGVVASGDLVYSSARRLYVATTSWPWRRATTSVHAFALDGARTTYVASGRLPGVVRDRWSFSEQDGHLRVVVGPPSGPPVTGTDSSGGTSGADGEAAASPASTLVVLGERGGRLVRTGQVGGLGRGEQVQAVRWLGDLAVVVTFRQTDPLDTVDLADPAHPRLLGSLHLPGFSGYLHPVGDHVLLGLGRDATTSGQDLGAQAATFDLSDPSHVRREAVVGFGADTDLAATSDPRALTYLPQLHTAVTELSDFRTGRTWFVALRVEQRRLVRTATWSSVRTYGADLRVLPLGGHRVALVDDGVRVVDVP